MGFLRKQWVFWENYVGFLPKKQCFLALGPTMIYLIMHMHFIIIKTIHVLHKLSFHNTIPHRSHSLIGQEL